MADIVEDDDIRPTPHYRERGPHRVVSADAARRGPRGGRVLTVLACSLVGIAVAFGLVQLVLMRGH